VTASATQTYRSKRQQYERLAELVKNLIHGLAEKTAIHVVSARAKTEESFGQKSNRQNDDGSLKYNDPLSQIEDLAGVRVICYTVSQVESLCELIEREFDITEKIDKGKELLSAGQVGYISKHFVVRLTRDRLNLPEYAPYSSFKCEVQIRTIFQHAWAEIEHQLQYKQSSNAELKSRFQALAGFIQVADREFENVSELGRKIAESTQTENEAAIVEEFEQDGHKLSNAAYLYGARPSELIVGGQYERAIETYNALITLQPNQVWHYVGRARAHALTGKKTQFDEDIKLIKNLKSKDKRVQDSIKKLNSIMI
jgi:putative GTP pyrophosphokinase